MVWRLCWTKTLKSRSEPGSVAVTFRICCGASEFKARWALSSGSGHISPLASSSRSASRLMGAILARHGARCIALRCSSASALSACISQYLCGPQAGPRRNYLSFCRSYVYIGTCMAACGAACRLSPIFPASPLFRHPPRHSPGMHRSFMIRSVSTPIARRIHGTLRRGISCAALAALLGAALPAGDVLGQVQLPTLGDRISGLISLDDEYKLGREFLRSVRGSSKTISDPLLNEYLVNVTHNLALHSELQDHRLAFIIIDSPELNAFAAPGGIIGVNGGLFLNAHTEGE